MNKLAAIVIILICVIISGVFLGIGTSLYSNAKKKGGESGTALGTVVGTAAGSFVGFTHGVSEGSEAGKAAGVSASDTTAKLGSEIKMIGKLKILEMDVTLTDTFSVGSDYFALLVWDGTASYTVDLEQCSVSMEGDTVKITVPHPVLNVYLDTEHPEKKAESDPSFFKNGSSQAGYEGYINSLKMTRERVRDTMVGYESFNETAERSAKATIERLAGAVVLNGKTVTVEFTGSEAVELA